MNPLLDDPYGPFLWITYVIVAFAASLLAPSIGLGQWQYLAMQFVLVGFGMLWLLAGASYGWLPKTV